MREPSYKNFRGKRNAKEVGIRMSRRGIEASLDSDSIVLILEVVKNIVVIVWRWRS